MTSVFYWCLGYNENGTRCANRLFVATDSGCQHHLDAGNICIEHDDEDFYAEFGRYPYERRESEESTNESADEYDETFVADNTTAAIHPEDDFEPDQQSISAESFDDSDPASDDSLGGFSSESDADNSGESSSEESSSESSSKSSSESSSESSEESSKEESIEMLPARTGGPIRRTRITRATTAGQKSRQITIDLTKSADIPPRPTRNTNTNQPDYNSDSIRLTALIAELSDLNASAKKLHSEVVMYKYLDKHVEDTTRELRKTRQELKKVSAKMAAVTTEILALQRRIYPTH